MNRAIMVLYAVFCFMCLGCDMNTSVDFILEEPKVQSENNIDFSVDWKYAIRLYYLDYHPHTKFILKVETNEHIADVFVSSYSIEVPELGINIHESELARAMILDNKDAGSTIDSTKLFWEKEAFDIYITLLPDTIKNEKQLVEFKKVKHIFLTVTFEYVMGNEQKQSSITWKFRPRVLKSSAFWDKWMSV